MGDQPLWERVVGGHFVLAKRSFWPNFFSQIVARLQWNPMAIDLGPDARAWPELPDERRRRLTTLLAGFCVAEDAVADHLTPFADAAREATLASQESLMAWVFFLQRRDEQRHAALFDSIGAEVLGLPGADAGERRDAAREHVPAAFLELFEEPVGLHAGRGQPVPDGVTCGEVEPSPLVHEAVARQVQEQEVVRPPVGEEVLDGHAHLMRPVVHHRGDREPADLRVGQEVTKVRGITGRGTQPTQHRVDVVGDGNHECESAIRCVVGEWRSRHRRRRL